MAGIGSKKLSEIFGSLMQIDNSTTGIDTTTRAIKDGNGTASSLSSSTNKFQVTPQSSDATDTIKFTDVDGNSLFVIDTTNDKILVGINQNHVATQYLRFGVSGGNSVWAGIVSNKHYAVPMFGNVQAKLEMGTGTNPDTSFTVLTTADDVVDCIAYIPDAIEVTGVNFWVGSDANGTNTMRCHLMSYAAVTAAGTTGLDLSDGIVVADGSDISNLGYEQGYYQSMTVQNASVAAGRVLMFVFRMDSVNADVSVNAMVKYYIK